MQTTLNKIREQGPCADGWKKLLQHLGKTTADDDALPLLVVLDSNGLDDALWCLRAVDGHEREVRLFAIWCARQVRHLMTDPCSIAALEVAEKFAHGDATQAELDAAWDAASASASASAWDAASASARDAASASASALAWDAASASAWAASDAAKAASDAAWNAACDAQEAKLREILSGA